MMIYAGIILWWLAWVMLACCPWRKATRSAMILGGVALGILGYYLREEMRLRYPILMITEDVVLRVGADESYGSAAVLKQNEKVMVYSSHKGWSKVKRDHLIGWIPSSVLAAERG